MMQNALIGFSGFVGSTMLKQTSFEALYRSINIDEICGNTFEVVVCAGAPAQKWLANRDPESDLKKIEGLISCLKLVTCKTFILISTVDVFKDPIGVDESTPIDEKELNAYGLNRRILEKFVEGHFHNHLIIRLPGLVGPGLRKNIIFDFQNNNDLYAIDSRSVFQFYPMENLWSDIQIALSAGLKLVHLTAEPISVADISFKCFGKSFKQINANAPSAYDFRTQYAEIYDATGYYQYSQRETIQAVLAYAKSESITLKAPAEKGA